MVGAVLGSLQCQIKEGVSWPRASKLSGAQAQQSLPLLGLQLSPLSLSLYLGAPLSNAGEHLHQGLRGCLPTGTIWTTLLMATSMHGSQRNAVRGASPACGI